MELTLEMKIQFTRLQTIKNLNKDTPLGTELNDIIYLLKLEIEQAEYIINMQYSDTMDEKYIKQTLTKIQEETKQTTYNIQPTKIVQPTSKIEKYPHDIIPTWKR